MHIGGQVSDFISIASLPNYNHLFSKNMPLTRRQIKNKSKVTKVEKPAPPKPKRKPVVKLPKLSKRELRARIRQRCLRRQNISPQKVRTLKMEQIEQLSHHQKLNCPICLQTYVQPTVTQCGHIFCLSCAEQSLKHKGSCSLCRCDVSLQQFKPEKILQQLLQLKLKKEADKQVIQSYKRRVEQFQLEQKKRKVNSEIKVGDFVDYWNDRAWKGGKVLEVMFNKQGDKIIKVQNQRAINQEKIYEFALNSRLIAKHRTFSKETQSFFRCWPQIRIDIFDIRQNFNTLFWDQPPAAPRANNTNINYQRGVGPRIIRAQTYRTQQRVGVQSINLSSEEDESESLIRFTFSFQRPPNPN